MIYHPSPLIPPPYVPAFSTVYDPVGATFTVARRKAPLSKGAVTRSVTGGFLPTHSFRHITGNALLNRGVHEGAQRPSGRFKGVIPKRGEIEIPPLRVFGSFFKKNIPSHIPDVPTSTIVCASVTIPVGATFTVARFKPSPRRGRCRQSRRMRCSRTAAS